MYLEYYRLKHAPFDITPNPRFLFHSSKHREAFNHMLYGIRARELARLEAAGFPAFTLIAYGAFWYPWYMRRLAERPANVLFALRQLLP